MERGVVSEPRLGKPAHLGHAWLGSDLKIWRTI